MGPTYDAVPDRPMIPAKGAGLVRAWLLVVAAMVYAMILVGGATRLTDSGLSITEWKPLLGAFPPMNAADWAEAFEKYRTMTAQAHQLNPNMSLTGFQHIYWWEWSHRELGRSIGVVFALPLLVFWLTGRTTKKLLPHLLVLFALGGLQGLVGWWMVSSGVETDLTSVAPYRLMTHFGLALFIIAYAFWLWLDLGATRRPASVQAGGWASALLWVAGLQMMLGALVAGLDAGRGYTDWPLMAGRFVPEAIFSLHPWWRNFLENEATTQFVHRMNAYLLLVLALWAAWKFRAGRYDNGGRGFTLTASLALGQGVLGVITLMNAAPLDLSLAHQALGTVVLLSAVRLVWATRPTVNSPSAAASGDVDKAPAHG
jgi:cytochrome c oxidase assembly protein subunit 15